MFNNTLGMDITHCVHITRTVRFIYSTHTHNMLGYTEKNKINEFIWCYTGEICKFRIYKLWSWLCNSNKPGLKSRMPLRQASSTRSTFR